MGIADESSHYFTQLAAAFVRGRLPGLPALPPAELIQAGLRQQLRLHKFKRNTELPRIHKVLGVLRGLGPVSLLDLGSGRGTFLWPLLDAFPALPVTAVDHNPIRAFDIQAVRRGGIGNLTSVLMDASRLGFADRSFDVVTILEVLEHLPQPERAVAEAVRVARRFVVASVPSKDDDNPEHLHLFSGPRLQELFAAAGATRVKVEYVLNHLIIVARVYD